jgi:Zn ribbon nucleic-acid-binding protein
MIHDEDNPRHWECVTCGRTFFTQDEAFEHEEHYEHETEEVS